MLTTVVDGRFPVRAYMCVRENFSYSVPAFDFLADQLANYASSVRGYRAIFERYAREGRAALTSAMLHEADKPQAIFELIKGDLRLFCYFPGDGSVVITNGVIKKGQKVDRNAVAECARARDDILGKK